MSVLIETERGLLRQHSAVETGPCESVLVLGERRTDLFGGPHGSPESGPQRAGFVPM